MKIVFPPASDGIIRIVQFNERHLSDRYVGWLNDLEVVRFSEQRHKTHTIDTCREYYLHQKESTNLFLAIEVLENEFPHIGNMGVVIDFNNKIADVSIIIGEKAVWGTGIGFRAWNLLIRLLFEQLNLRIITAGTMELNVPMIKLMNKSGMKIDAVLPKRFLHQGKEVGLVLSSISK